MALGEFWIIDLNPDSIHGGVGFSCLQIGITLSNKQNYPRSCFDYEIHLDYCGIYRLYVSFRL